MMKCATMFAVAAMAMAAVAQEPASKPEMRMRPRGERPMMMGGMGGMGMMDPVVRAVIMNPQIAEKIGVTQEQAAKLKALNDDKSSIRSIQERIRKGMERQTELLKADKVDEAAVMAAIDEVWDARKEVAKAQTRRVIAVKSILTAEQVKQATEALKAMRGNGERRRGPRPEGRKPGKAPAADAVTAPAADK